MKNVVKTVNYTVQRDVVYFYCPEASDRQTENATYSFLLQTLHLHGIEGRINSFTCFCGCVRFERSHVAVAITDYKKALNVLSYAGWSISD